MNESMNSLQKTLHEIEVKRIKKDIEDASATVLRKALANGLTADEFYIDHAGRARTDRVVLRSGDLRITIDSGV